MVKWERHEENKSEGVWVKTHVRQIRRSFWTTIRLWQMVKITDPADRRSWKLTFRLRFLFYASWLALLIRTMNWLRESVLWIMSTSSCAMDTSRNNLLIRLPDLITPCSLFFSLFLPHSRLQPHASIPRIRKRRSISWISAKIAIPSW